MSDPGDAKAAAPSEGKGPGVEGKGTGAAAGAAAKEAGSKAKGSGAKDASNSLAFVLLNKLIEEGKISEAQGEMYKQKYERLNERVIDMYESELGYFEEAKRLKKKLSAMRTDLKEKNHKVILVKDDIESLQEKKRIAAKALEPKLMNVQVLDQELTGYRVQEEDFKNQLTAMVKSSDEAAKPLLEDLTGKVRQCQKEIQAQKDNTAKETKARENYLNEIKSLRVAIENLQREKHEKRRKLDTVLTEPKKIAAQADKLSRERGMHDKAARALLGDIAEAKRKLAAQIKIQNHVKAELDQLREEKAKYRGALGKQIDTIQDLEGRIRELERRRDELDEAKRSLLVDIELQRKKFKDATDMRKRYYGDSMAEMKKCENYRRKIATVKAVLPGLYSTVDVLQEQIVEMKEKLVKVVDEIDDVMGNKDLLLYQHLEIEESDVDASAKVAAVKKEIEDAKVKVEEISKIETKLKREISSLSSRRELKGREASVANTEYREAKEQVKIKNLILGDLVKQVAAGKLKVQLNEEEFKKIKAIKEKLFKQTHVGEQALGDMREKIAILQHEVQILNNESVTRVLAIKEEERCHQIEIRKRIAQRDRKAKRVAELMRLKQKEQDQIKQIAQLSSIVNEFERKILRIQKMYIELVDQRNITGVRLIDRGDELSIIQEKAKIQESIVANGKKAIVKRVDQIRQLHREIAEADRTEKSLVAKLPGHALWETTRRTLKECQMQLAAEKQRVVNLASDLSNPAAPNAEGKSRVNKLGGFDPEPEQLQAKIDVLKEQLNEQKEKLVEKELILHEVSSLSDKLCVEAAENRQWTLELAKKINHYQSTIRQTTRSLMATVSELSMYQATAMKLDDERQTVMEDFEAAKERFAAGQAPTDDAEDEWVRMHRERQRQRDILMSHKRRTAEVRRSYPGQARSSAEVRPNAYLPNDEVAIPKPYGNHAPFKPSVLGANMRHIRRPAARSLDAI